MNELKLTLPLEVIQLKEEELALLKGGANLHEQWLRLQLWRLL